MAGEVNSELQVCIVWLLLKSTGLPELCRGGRQGGACRGCRGVSNSESLWAHEPVG